MIQLTIFSSFSLSCFALRIVVPRFFSVLMFLVFCCLFFIPSTSPEPNRFFSSSSKAEVFHVFSFYSYYSHPPITHIIWLSSPHINGTVWYIGHAEYVIMSLGPLACQVGEDTPLHNARLGLVCEHIIRKSEANGGMNKVYRIRRNTPKCYHCRPWYYSLVRSL